MGEDGGNDFFLEAPLFQREKTLTQTSSHHRDVDR